MPVDPPRAARRLRFAQRVCSETATGPDPAREGRSTTQRQVIEQYTFTELKIGPQVARTDLKSIFKARSRAVDHRRRSRATRPKSAETGWTVTNAPAGFRKVAELQRTLPGRAQPVAQIVSPTASRACRSSSSPTHAARAPSRASSEDGTTTFFVRPDGRPGGVGAGRGAARHGAAGGTKRRTPSLKFRVPFAAFQAHRSYPDPMKRLQATFLGALLALRPRRATAQLAAPRRTGRRSRHIPPGAPAQVLPDFADLVEKYGPAVVNINTRTRGSRQPAAARARRGRPVLRVLPPLHARPAGRRRAPRRGNRRAQRRSERARSRRGPLRPFGLGSGFIVSRRRLHRHQRARGRERRGDHGALHRQARVQGQGDRRRHAQRRRGDQGRGDGPAGREDRRHQASCAWANGWSRSARPSASPTP